MKAQVEKGAGKALGRVVQIEKVNLRPWSLEAEVFGLRIKTAGGEADALAVDRVYANTSLASVWRFAPVVEQLTVEGPRLRLARLADGQYDVDDVLETLAKRPKSDQPARFALYNLSLKGGSVDFDDRPVSKRHELRDLTIGVPFLSTLAAHVKVDVEPRLAFKLNGSSFDSAADGTPFAQTRAGLVSLKFAKLSLAPYLPYLPAGSPLRLTQAVLSADIKADFAEPANGPAQLKFSGSVQAADVALQGPAKAASALGSPGSPATPWLAWQNLTVGLKDVQPLARRVELSSIELAGAQVLVQRSAGGDINWAGLSSPTAPSGPTTQADPAPATTKSGPSSPAPWLFKLDKLSLADTSVRYLDQATGGKAFQAALLSTQVAAGPLSWGGSALEAPVPLQVNASVALGAQTSSSPGLAQVALGGTVSDKAASLSLQLRELGLAALEPYWAAKLAAKVQGSLSVESSLTWAAASASSSPSLVVNAGEVVLSKLLVTQTLAPAAAPGATAAPSQPSGPLAQAGLIKAAFTLDALGRRVEVQQLSLDQPALRIWRDAQGKLLPGLLVSAPTSEAPAAAVAAEPPALGASPPAAPSKPVTPWAVRLAELQLTNGLVGWRDFTVSQRGTELEVSRIRFSVKNVSTDQAVNAPVALSAVVGGPREDTRRNAVAVRERAASPVASTGAVVAPAAGGLLPPATSNTEEAPGLVAWRGNLGWKPGFDAPTAKGQLSIRQLPLARFERYSRAYTNVDLLRGELNFRGDIALALPKPGAPDMQLAGDLNLADLQANSVVPAEPLLTWQSFAINGLAVAVKGGALESVDVRETSLIDFFARLIVTPEGRFNLQDLLKKPAESGAVGSATTALPTASSSTPSTVISAAKSAPRITVGASSLVNGRVNFSDRFIRPNYSANLSELTGRIGAFSSVKAASGELQMADVELRGKAEGTALLDIRGKINPATSPLALDIKGKVTDLELAPLTPYAAKYAGYAIERGKLSVDVSYKIEPDGKLTANNNVVLNQLTFGERIESPTATRLPVLFAVALLKDRNGVIDVNLPISGSLNDPQFSIGGIVWRIIGNLIVRAITAPFSLLSAAFGGAGGEDLSFVEFAPGTTDLAASGRTRLDSVAKALADRPALKLTVTGQADPADERDAAKKLKLDQLVLAEKRREVARDAPAPSSAQGTATTAPLTVEPSELERYTRAAYRRMDFAGKPRNLVGLLRDLPLNEMNALMLTNIQVTQDDMRALALQRGVAVRDYLLAKGVPSERMFLANPRLRGSAGDVDNPPADSAQALPTQPSPNPNAAPAAGGAAPGAPANPAAPGPTRWTPRAQLSLGA